MAHGNRPICKLSFMLVLLCCTVLNMCFFQSVYVRYFNLLMMLCWHNVVVCLVGVGFFE